MARAVTVRALAREVGLDLDEALVTLWDAGFEDVEDVDQAIPPRLRSSARVALGLANPKELRQISYWERRWELDRSATLVRLKDEFGVEVGRGARVLPKGALKRIRKSYPVILEPAAGPLQGKSPEVPRDRQPLVWNPPGRKRDVAPLTAEEICRIHEALVEDFRSSGDPIDPPGVRHEHLLHSAASRPETSLGGVRKYDSLEAYAAALLHSLVHNHPFYNGNKRTALVSMLVLLDRNNVLLTCNESELFRQVLRVSQHRLVPTGTPDRADHEVLAIAHWICERSRGIQRGERVLKWKELRKILTRLGCNVGTPLPGNKIKIEREVEERGLFKRRRTLRTTAGYRNDGSEVDASSLNHIRRDLHFDERHGYDSDYFYGTDPREPDEFIAQYRGLLKRLGRL